VDPSSASAVAEDTLDLLQTSPHTSPVAGTVSCAYDAGRSTITAVWDTGAPSLFIDVYLLSGDIRFYIGTMPGEANKVTIADTLLEDSVELQFFATTPDGCYGSEFLRCSPSGKKRYIQGLCSGVGDQEGKPQISAAIFGLSFLFSGGPAPPCATACDSNGDGGFDLSDMVYILSYLFLGGPAPSSWTDRDGDGAADPACVEARPEDDCRSTHASCSG
jgi:hypothetical protein